MDNNPKAPEAPQNEERQLGGIFLIIGFIVGLGLIAILVNKIMFGTKPPSIVQAVGGGTEITLYRDYDSHFRLQGSINGTPVTFLIDTGATSIAVSNAFAAKIDLPKKTPVETETANGNGIGYLTKIDTLTVGGFELHGLSAIIVQNLPDDEALLGMNVLKNFNIQQEGDAMKLTIPPSTTTGANRE